MDKKQKLDRINHNINAKNKQFLPVLYVRTTSMHVYVQLVHDSRIVLDVSTLNQKELLTAGAKSYNLLGAAKIGKIAGEKVKFKLQELGFTNFVTNRGLKSFQQSQVLRIIDNEIRSIVVKNMNEGKNE